MKRKDFFKMFFAVTLSICVVLFSAISVAAETGDDYTSDNPDGYIDETDEVNDPVTDPEIEPETEPQTEPVTEPETEPQTEPETEPETQEETQPQTDSETQEETQEQTDGYVEDIDDDDDTYDDMLPTVDEDSLQVPTAVGSHIEDPVVNMTAGIVSWVCVGVGVVVIVAVLLSTKSSDRKNAGKQRYGQGDKITGRKPPVEY